MLKNNDLFWYNNYRWMNTKTPIYMPLTFLTSQITQNMQFNIAVRLLFKMTCLTRRNDYNKIPFKCCQKDHLSSNNEEHIQFKRWRWKESHWFLLNRSKIMSCACLSQERGAAAGGQEQVEVLKQTLESFAVPAELSWRWGEEDKAEDMEKSWTDIVISHEVCMETGPQTRSRRKTRRDERCPNAISSP